MSVRVPISIDRRSLLEKSLSRFSRSLIETNTDVTFRESWEEAIKIWTEVFQEHKRPLPPPRFYLKENGKEGGYGFAIEDFRVPKKGDWETVDHLRLRIYKNVAAVNEFFSFANEGVVPILEFVVDAEDDDDNYDLYDDLRIVLLRYMPKLEGYFTLENFIKATEEDLFSSINPEEMEKVTEELNVTAEKELSETEGGKDEKKDKNIGAPIEPEVESGSREGVKQREGTATGVEESQKVSTSPVFKKSFDEILKKDIDMFKALKYITATSAMDMMQLSTLSKEVSIKVNPDEIYINKKTLKPLLYTKYINRLDADEMVVAMADADASIYYENLTIGVYKKLQILMTKFYLLGRFAPNYYRQGKDKASSKEEATNKNDPVIAENNGKAHQLLFLVLLSQVFDAWIQMAEYNEIHPEKVFRQQRLSTFFFPIQDVLGFELPLLEFARSIRFNKSQWFDLNMHNELHNKAELLWQRFYLKSKLNEETGLPVWLEEIRDLLKFF
jgi:hypothetical protein